jgi:tetratricopeptide (TPR) repeat protein
LASRSYKEAISDLSAALALKPKYKQALAQRAKLYRLLGQCQQSSADYQALQVLDAAHAEVAAGMGPAAQCAAQLHEAQTNFQANNFHRAREAFSSVLDTMSEVRQPLLFN